MARRSARILEKKLVKARNHQFPLMELPREVRDMIYEACLAFDGAIFIKDKRRGPGSCHRPRESAEDFDRGMASIESSATANGRKLFYVSKQIHDEAVSIFYRKNTFEFASLTEMEYFIRNMGPRNQHNLRSVIVYYWAAYMEFARPSMLLTQCVGLRDLTIVLCDECMEYRNNMNTGGPKYDWAELKVPQAFVTLLRIRGLDNVRLILSPRAGWLASNRKVEWLPAWEDAVQVMKQPRPVAQTRTKRNKVKK